MNKIQIRKKILAQFKKKIPNRKRRELKLKEKILSNSLFLQSKKIAIYSAIQHEVNLDFLFQFLNKKKIYLPVFENENYYWQEINSQKDLTIGRYNILEPKKKNKNNQLQKIDIFFVPAIAFQIKNYYRIGRGGGYYDGLLKNQAGIKIGIGFKEQGYLEQHPIDPWDIAMDQLWLG